MIQMVVTTCQDGVLYLSEYKLLDKPRWMCCSSLGGHLSQEFVPHYFPQWPHTAMGIPCVSHLFVMSSASTAETETLQRQPQRSNQYYGYSFGNHLPPDALPLCRKKSLPRPNDRSHRLLADISSFTGMCTRYSLQLNTTVNGLDRDRYKAVTSEDN
jgi:hypothetical protein